MSVSHDNHLEFFYFKRHNIIIGAKALESQGEDPRTCNINDKVWFAQLVCQSVKKSLFTIINLLSIYNKNAINCLYLTKVQHFLTCV